MKFYLHLKKNIFFAGAGPESSRKRSNNHFCALKTSKRCAFCEIGFNEDESDDSWLKLTKSFQLFEGCIIDFLWVIVFKEWRHLIEAKKESFAAVKAECSRLMVELDDIIEKQKDKLEKIANQNSANFSVYMTEFETFVKKKIKLKILNWIMLFFI